MKVCFSYAAMGMRKRANKKAPDRRSGGRFQMKEREGARSGLDLFFPDDCRFSDRHFRDDRLKLWQGAEFRSFQFGFTAAGTANERECGDENCRNDANHGIGVNCGFGERR